MFKPNNDMFPNIQINEKNMYPTGNSANDCQFSGLRDRNSVFNVVKPKAEVLCSLLLVMVKWLLQTQT